MVNKQKCEFCGKPACAISTVEFKDGHKEIHIACDTCWDVDTFWNMPGYVGMVTDNESLIQDIEIQNLQKELKHARNEIEVLKDIIKDKNYDIGELRTELCRYESMVEKEEHLYNTDCIFFNASGKSCSNVRIDMPPSNERDNFRERRSDCKGCSNYEKLGEILRCPNCGQLWRAFGTAHWCYILDQTAPHTGECICQKCSEKQNEVDYR